MSKTIVTDGKLMLALAVCGGMTSFAAAEAPQNAPAGVQSTQQARQAAKPVIGPNGVEIMEAGGGMNVLHYEDFTLGTSAYADALASMGAIVTFTADPFIFELELQSGSYDAVVAAHQNSFALAGWEDDLVNWVAANPGSPVLISDWRVNNPDTYAYLSALGFSQTASVVNPFQANPVAGGVFDGFGSASLASPGWGIYAYGTGGGTTEATTESGAAFVSRNGSVFYNGFLSDVFADPSAGSAWVQAELNAAGGEPIDCQCDAIYDSGDRVVALVDNPTGAADILAGATGTVLSGTDPTIFDYVLVEWDDWALGHGGNGFTFCPPIEEVGNSRWWVLCSEIEAAGPPEECQGDVNGDGVVDISDLLIVLGDWGCGG